MVALQAALAVAGILWAQAIPSSWAADTAVGVVGKVGNDSALAPRGRVQLSAAIPASLSTFQRLFWDQLGGAMGS